MAFPGRCFAFSVSLPCLPCQRHILVGKAHFSPPEGLAGKFLARLHWLPGWLATWRWCQFSYRLSHINFWWERVLQEGRRSSHCGGGECWQWENVRSGRWDTIECNFIGIPPQTSHQGPSLPDTNLPPVQDVAMDPTDLSPSQETKKIMESKL